MCQAEVGIEKILKAIVLFLLIFGQNPMMIFKTVKLKIFYNIILFCKYDEKYEGLDK